MKILKPTAYYEPEQYSSRHLNSDLEKTFAEAGFEYVIVAPVPTRGIDAHIRKQYSAKKYEEKYGGKVRVYRFGLMPERNSTVLRAFRYTWMCVKQYFCCIRERDVDIVYAASTPPIQGMLAAKIATKLHVPFLYNLQDVFPDSLVSAGFCRKESLLYKIGRKIEDYTYRHADRIIVISEEIKSNIYHKGVPLSKIEVIPNWINTDEITYIDRDDNPVFDEFGIDRRKFIVLYAGSIGKLQGTDVILEAAERLSNNESICFVVFGSGAEAHYFSEKAKSLDNVKYFDMLELSKAAQVYSLGDVAIVTSKSGVDKCSMPSKTWFIMATSRAIIATVDCDSELGRLITDNNAGISIEAENADALAKAIQFTYSNRDLLVRMEKNGREYVVEHATQKIGTKKYCNIISNTAAASMK